MELAERINYLERNQPSFVWKRRVLITYLMAREAVLGLQYSIILPSAWKYLKRMEVEIWFYGMVLSMAAVGGIIALPIVGWAYDRTKSTKNILTITNMLGMLGSFTYSLPFSPWLPFWGRFVVGGSLAIGPIIQGEIAWTVRPENRLRIFSFVFFGFFIGLSVGPPLSLAFKDISFDIINWHIDYANFPGIFMALLWLLFELLNRLFVCCLAKEYIVCRDGNIWKNSVLQMLGRDDDCESTVEDECSELHKTAQFQSTNRKESTLRSALIEVLHSEIMVIICTTIMTWLYLFEGESLIPIITQDGFGWNVVQTNVVFVIVGISCIIGYTVLGCIGDKVSDITCLLLMLQIGSLGPIFLMLYHEVETGHLGKRVLFSIAVLIAGLIEPVCNAVSRSLMSKVTPSNVQGTMGSILSITKRLGNFLGTVYGALVLKNMIAFNVVSTGLFVAIFVWLLVSRKQLEYRKMKYSGTS